ncbi:MAG: hypothetical protein U0625_00415 [Phycisphaerales bacterium]
MKLPRMRAPSTNLLLVAGALVAATLGWLVHSGRATALSGFERAAAIAQIGAATDTLLAVRQQRERRPALDARLNGVVQHTLGERLDAVDTALRARLNRIAEETGLGNLLVSTGSAVDRRSPARSEMARMNLPRSMREETDFVELRATLAGEGAVDQVLRLVHRIAVDPMLKRVESVKFDPVRDGSRVRVTMRLSTIFVPGREPASLPPAPTAEALAGFAKYASLASRNPFRVPAPPAPTAVAAAPAAAPATDAPPAPAGTPAAAPIEGFPYGQWFLTGVIEGPAGTEAWFRNIASGERRALRVQDTIAEFALVGLDADQARIAAGGATYRLRVGDNLEARALETK